MACVLMMTGENKRHERDTMGEERKKENTVRWISSSFTSLLLPRRVRRRRRGRRRDSQQAADKAGRAALLSWLWFARGEKGREGEGRGEKG